MKAINTTIAFDLDGTLDREPIRDLCVELINAGWQVHIITGVFPEAEGWQDAPAKRAKLDRLMIEYTEVEKAHERHDPVLNNRAYLHIITAVPSTYDRDYRLADLGLRKGALCEELGVTLFIDDSEVYCEMVPKMSGGTTVLHVR